jgi:hypothetical protein
MDLDCRDASCVSGTAPSVTVRNTLFRGQVDFTSGGIEQSCLYWWDDGTLSSDPVDFDFNLAWMAKDDECPGTNSVCLDPLVVDAELSTFDGHLQAGSPAIDRGTPAGAPPFDLEGNPRVGPPDIGAFEFSPGIFADGFESGTTGAWSNSTP